MSLPNKPYIGDQTPNQPFYSPEVPATFDRLFGSLVPNIQLDPEPEPGAAWVRPADWLPMPTVSETEQKFVGLFAVYDLPENFLAVYFEEDYVVDWGDGSIENFASGETAQHSYAWSDVSASTLTSQGYRQVLVTVIPQQGQSLSAIDLSARHSSAASCVSTTPWLDIVVSMPNAASGSSIIFVGEYYGEGCGYLQQAERIRVLSCGDFTLADGLFSYMGRLRVIALPEENNIESIDSIFYGSFALTEIPLFGLSSIDSMAAMFQNLEGIATVPPFDTSSVTNMEDLFLGCRGLTTVPTFDTSSVTNMAEMFGGCFSLTSIPELDVSSVSNFSNCFSGCYSLQSAPLQGTSVNISFEGCLLGRQAIVDIFNGLANASATIDVRNNYGAAALTSGDRAIATGKGWTVLS